MPLYFLSRVACIYRRIYLSASVLSIVAALLQIEYLVSQGCVQILSDLLGESSMVMMALEGIERVLSVGDLRVVRNAIASHSHGDKVCGNPFFYVLCRVWRCDAQGVEDDSCVETNALDCCALRHTHGPDDTTF